MTWAWSSPRRPRASLPFLLMVMLCMSAAGAHAQGSGTTDSTGIDAGSRYGSAIQTSDSSTIEPGLKTYLEPNVPNPFSGPSTRIAYTLAEETRVVLTVYDYFYKVVAVLVDDELQPPGRKIVPFVPEGLPSGMFIYELRTSKGIETRRMLYIK
jgi:hypothetical protein